jgi:hypothetical protein
MICFSFVACGCRDLSCTADTTDMVAIGHEEREREKERRERERRERERKEREREERFTNWFRISLYFILYLSHHKKVSREIWALFYSEMFSLQNYFSCGIALRKLNRSSA